MTRPSPIVRRRAAALAVAASVPVLLAVPAAQTAAAATPAKPSATTTFRSQVVRATVAQRTSHHRSTLTRQKCLDRLAQAQAARMAKKQDLYHQPLMPVLTTCGFNEVAENIAVGYPSAKGTVNAWMHSPGHRANILHGSYRRIGVGAVRDKHGVWWVSELFGRAY